MQLIIKKIEILLQDYRKIKFHKKLLKNMDLKDFGDSGIKK